MSQIQAIVETLTLQGVELWVEGEQLRYNGPKAVLTPQVLEKLKQYKATLLQSLSSRTYLPAREQQHAWKTYQEVSQKALHHTTFIASLRGKLDTVAFQRSWQTLIQRHMTLRTTYHANMAMIHGTQPVHLTQIEAQGWEEEEIKSQIVARQAHPFDLAQGPLLRITLFARENQEQILLLTAPQIVLDDRSLEKLLNEFGQLYAAVQNSTEIALPTVVTTPEIYATSQTKVYDEAATVVCEMESEKLMLDLPLDYSRRAQQGPLAHQSLQLSATLVSQLHNLVREMDTTLDVLFLATLKALLYRYTGQEVIPIGIVQHPSHYADFADLVGGFATTTLLQTMLSTASSTGKASTFVDLLRQSDQELQSNQGTFSPVNPQVLFGLMGTVSVAATQNVPRQWGTLQVEPMILDDGEFAFEPSELKVEAREIDGKVTLFFAYRADLFAPATISRFMSHFQTLLTAVASNPEQSISQLRLLSQAEHHQLAIEWTDTQREYPNMKGVHHLFQEQAERTPNAVALILDGDEKRNAPKESLTYGELNARANQLAHYLQSMGVSSETESLVGLCVERSVEMIVGVLGILKAGGAYVPLDPNYPQERISFMLQDANVPLLLTQQHLQERLSINSAQTEVIYLDSDWVQIAQCDNSNLSFKLDPNSLAYVLYTSGSTGRPKGVMIEHHSPTALISWAQGVYSPSQLSGVLASTSICFDLSVYELFLPLSVGGKIILAENALHLPTISHKDQVTLINTVPSSIEELLRQRAIPSSVQTINLAGEPLRQTLVDKLYALPTVQKVYDLYGPSEDTTYSTFTLRTEGGVANIGKPIDNTQAYILDPNLCLLPVGIAGELYLGGAGLAQGYLNRPELTAEKFIDNPFASSGNPSRLYKTGDLVRWLPEPENIGNIEYLGRIDHQVKIRGFRIELGEIEAVLGQHPDIEEVVLVAHAEKNDSGEDEQRQLVAYVAGSQREGLSKSKLRDYLEQKLPSYMIPSLFVMLDALPRTPNGKVDRKALPAPEIAVTVTEITAPGNPVEAVIAHIWCETLSLTEVGIHDKFMDLGGHSLQAMQVINKISSTFQIQFPLSRIIDAPTVAQLAQLLVEYEKTPGQIAKLARLQQRLNQLIS